jgi:hypothetical protein
LRPESCWNDCLARRKSIRLCVPSHRKSGFVYSAKMDGRDIKEISGSLKNLTRDDVEIMFANYVAGK